ncbi:FkbM family methyltransferase [Patescibacteria group bacterium]|nr:FkbM family methyltransferase [Patescibacteria group bacterium]
MLINLGEILKKYKIEPKGIIHVGAHWAEEHDDYLSYGIGKFVYIEPCQNAYAVMKSRLGNCADDVLLLNVACGSKEGAMNMYASENNQGQSNSLLEPNLHLQQHPEVVFNSKEEVRVTLLDKLPIDKWAYNILAMDVQGYEGEVLKGATQTLQHIDIIYTEVNRGDTYKGNMLIEEMDEYLLDYQRVETYWPSPNWTWGDACYIKRSLL